MKRIGVRHPSEWTYIVWVDTPVELFDTDVLHSPSPMDAIKHHLLRMGRIVSPGLQEAPVQPLYRNRRGDLL